MSRRSRKFFVTYWTPKEIMWYPNVMRYACKCDDQCGEEYNGKWHGHYYVYYNNARTCKDIRNYYGKDCYIEIPKSNNTVIRYILGKGDHAESKSNIVERGHKPWDSKYDLIREEFNGLPPSTANIARKQSHVACKQSHVACKPNHTIKPIDRYKGIKVTFITGPSYVDRSLKLNEEYNTDDTSNDLVFEDIKYEEF